MYVIGFFSHCLFHSLVAFFIQGNPVGQSGLGMAYLYGRGVPVVRKLLHMIVIFKVMANLISNLQFLALERGRR